MIPHGQLLSTYFTSHTRVSSDRQQTVFIFQISGKKMLSETNVQDAPDSFCRSSGGRNKLAPGAWYRDGFVCKHADRNNSREK